MMNHDWDELSWLAFRYVAGEMTADEETLFEQRLADDQVAREAVEQAVELHESIRQVAAEPVPLRRPIVLRPVAWAATAAAGVVLVLCLYWLRTPVPDPTPRHPAHVLAPSDAPVSAAVVSAWAELQREQAHENSVLDGPDAPVPPEAALEVLEEREESLPSWLLTAVAAETRRLKEKK